MDTLEKFHIYAETRNNNHIIDKNTVKHNAIFDVVCSHNPTRNTYSTTPSKPGTPAVLDNHPTEPNVYISLAFSRKYNILLKTLLQGSNAIYRYDKF